MNNQSNKQESITILSKNNTVRALPLRGHMLSHKRSQTKQIHFSSFLVPANLQLEALLESSGNGTWVKPSRLKKLHWLVSCILYSYATGYTKTNCFVNIHSAAMRKNLTSRWDRAVPKLLHSLGIIEVNPIYSSRGFSRSYRLTASYRNQPLSRRNFSEKKLRLKKDDSEVTNPEQEWIFRSIQRATVDEEAFKASQERAQMPVGKLIRAEETIHSLREYKIDLRGGKAQRRVRHVLTQAPAAIRRFVQIDGERLNEYDVKSCQPTLLLTLYPDLACSEAVVYRAALRTGFYETVAGKTDELTKKQFGVFISPKYKGNVFGRAFEAQFPILAAAIRSFKGSLSCYLQDIEAEIIIYRGATRCIELGLPIITIHDGYLATKKTHEIIASIIQMEFERRCGFVPIIRRK